MNCQFASPTLIETYPPPETIEHTSARREEKIFYWSNPQPVTLDNSFYDNFSETNDDNTFSFTSRLISNLIDKVNSITPPLDGWLGHSGKSEASQLLIDSCSLSSSSSSSSEFDTLTVSFEKLTPSVLARTTNGAPFLPPIILPGSTSNQVGRTPTFFTFAEFLGTVVISLIFRELESPQKIQTTIKFSPPLSQYQAIIGLIAQRHFRRRRQNEALLNLAELVLLLDRADDLLSKLTYTSGSSKRVNVPLSLFLVNVENSLHKISMLTAIKTGTIRLDSIQFDVAERLVALFENHVRLQAVNYLLVDTTETTKKKKKQKKKKKRRKKTKTTTTTTNHNQSFSSGDEDGSCSPFFTASNDTLVFIGTIIDTIIESFEKIITQPAPDSDEDHKDIESLWDVNSMFQTKSTSRFQDLFSEETNDDSVNNNVNNNVNNSVNNKLNLKTENERLLSELEQLKLEKNEAENAIILKLKTERNVFRSLTLSAQAEVAMLRNVVSTLQPRTLPPKPPTPAFLLTNNTMYQKKLGSQSVDEFENLSSNSKNSESHKVSPLLGPKSFRRHSSFSSGAGATAAAPQFSLGGGGERFLPQSKLSIDILKFANKIDSEVAKVQGKRDKVLARLKQICSNLWPRSTLRVFGSSATNLSLPSSDVDLVITLPRVHKGKFEESPGILEGVLIKETLQEILARRLKEEVWVDSKSIKVSSERQTK